MSIDSHVFVDWEEQIVSNEKGNRIVHFYLKDDTGNLVLTVVGTEKSIRHMIYVIPEEFFQDYGSNFRVNASTKWRARREVVDWLRSVVSKHCSPLNMSNSVKRDSTQALESREHSPTGSTALRNPNTMVQIPRKLKSQNSDITWSGVAWTCYKQLKHYPSFCRNEITMAVHSFVFVSAEEEIHYIAYLEDLYEDKKRQKKVKVRWFHQNHEINNVIPQLNAHPREVFYTSHAEVIGADCIVGPASVLTPNHYEKCLAVAPETLSSGLRMCFRQVKNKKVKPFALRNLYGYSNQPILSYLNRDPIPEPKSEGPKSKPEEEEEFTDKGQDGKNDEDFVGPEKSEPACTKLKIRLSRTGPAGGVKPVGPETQMFESFKVNDSVELLCQDSGVRGCWFRCKILQVSPKRLKVRYLDLQDADDSGNLEEWVPASRVAAPDKLGMRSSGRLTIRPWPTEVSLDCSLEVGMPIDAWWCDGWWEGVVTRVNISGSDSIQVYFSGENRFLAFRRKELRKSRDWVENKWEDIKAKPDIHSYISSVVNPSKMKQKQPICVVSKHEPIQEEKLLQPPPSMGKSGEPKLQ